VETGAPNAMLGATPPGTVTAPGPGVTVVTGAARAVPAFLRKSPLLRTGGFWVTVVIVTSGTRDEERYELTPPYPYGVAEVNAVEG
jgi:hypothetical protein